MQPREYTLYGLKRPDEDTIRYIGITCSDLGLRLSQHISARGKNPHKENWIAKMLPLRPEIIPYAVGLTKDEACELEIFVIQKLRDAGHNLLNVSFGGESGSYGIKRSIETCRRISQSQIGKILSKETREKMSASRTGRPSGMLGKLHSWETKKKMSIKKLGIPKGSFSSEHIEKLRQAKLGKKQTPEHRANQALAQQARRKREKERNGN